MKRTFPNSLFHTFWIIWIFSIVFYSCDPVSPVEEIRNALVGHWQIESLELIDCEDPAFNRVIDDFVSCSESTLVDCLDYELRYLQNGKALFRNVTNINLDLIFSVEGIGAYTIMEDVGIRTCFEGQPCDDMAEYVLVDDKLIITTSNVSNLGTVCTSVATFVRGGNLKFGAFVHIPFDDDFFDTRLYLDDDDFGNRNDARRVNAKISNGVELDGDDQILFYRPSTFRGDNDAFSVAFWMKNEEGADPKTIMSCQDFIITAGNDNLSFSVPATGVSSAAIIHDFDEDVFTHIVLTFDGANFQIFVDGVLTGVRDNETNLSLSDFDTDVLSIGGEGDFTSTWEGVIDELYIFDRAITSDEIGEIFRCR